ncbi:MAG TPA: single-stranded DNA-binding protein [Oscillospiraceae bacterium]|nr:single-stranded DNA-binding protein [Oscillospiraceae bacterium]HXK78069.1 single-stranded DNA-binding protein [Oscillospiraceae bacterium]
MNRVVLLGRLAADPELRTTGTGISVCSFTIAVDRPYTKASERQTDWIDIVAWRNTAEFICKYFQKGKPIIIEGTLQTRNWEDKSGQKRKSVEVVADNAEFVPGTKDGGTSTSGRPDTHTDFAPPVADPAPVAFSNGEAEDFTVVEDDDLPF